MMKTPLTVRYSNHGPRRMAALLLCVCLLATMAPMTAFAAHVVLDASVTHVVVTGDTSLGKSTDCSAAVGTVKAGVALELYSQTTMTAADGAEWYQVKFAGDANGYALLKASAARAATADELAAIRAGTYTGGTTATASSATGTVTSAYQFATTNAVNVVLRTAAGGERSGKLISAKGTTVQVLTTATVSSIGWTQIYYSSLLYWVQSKYLNLLSDADNNTYYAAHQNAVYTGASTGGATGTTGSTTTTTVGTLKTTSSVNIRKYASTSSTKLGVVPKGVSMGYTNTAAVNGNVWYYITYGGVTGYVMGRYVSATGTSGGTTGDTTTDTTTPLGKITTTSGVKLRKSASQTADKYGLVPKNTTLDYYGTATVGGVTWYRVKYSGHTGYLMGTYVTLNGSTGSGTVIGGGSTANPNASEKTYVKLAAAASLYTASTATGTPAATAPAGSVLQLGSAAPYTGTDGASYYTILFGNTQYNVQATAVTGNTLTNDQLIAYFKGTLWVQGNYESFKRSANIRGDVRVHGVQYALKLLGYYTGALDGDYGRGTENAVKQFQRAQKLEVDGFAGNDTQTALYAKVLGTGGGASGGGSTGGGSTGGGTTPTPDSDKSYVRLTTDIYAFTSATKPTDISQCTRLPAGSVLQLVSVTPLTESGIEYYVLYYLSKPYRVLGAEVKAMILSAADLSAYITSYWSQSTFESLRRPDNLTGDIRVHALQLALKQLGYYTGVIDGELGSGTEGAVKKYQRAAKLEVDGFAGQDTQSSLYQKVLGSSGGSSGGGTASTDKTYVQLGAAATLYRDTACTQAATTAPAGSVLQLLNPTGYTQNGMLYYQIYYSSTLYCVPASSVESGKMSAATLNAYLVQLWREGYKVNINSDVAWVGDVRVHAMQLALQQLGYYTGALDGSFGSGTESAVRNFQRAKGLTRDGRCGPDTTTVLYAAALAAANNGSVVVGNNYGYLSTTGASTVLYAQPSTSAAQRITLLTAGTVLTRASSAVQAGTGGSFYQVSYGGTAYVLASAVKELSSTDYTNFLSAATTGVTEAYYSYTLKKGSKDDANGYVSTLQRRLQYLGFYYLDIDGSYGDGTLTAVQNFQKAVGLTADGIAASATLHKLYGTKAASGSSEFGAVTAVYSPNIEAGRWFTTEGGTVYGGVPGVFKQGVYAMVYDCATGLSFRVRRWAGAFHADVEPATAADTQVMCQIYGVTYPTGTPTSAQLKQINADTLCWPNINATSHWQRRSVLVNVGGKVYCGSMYGVPHNADDSNTITNNNYYGQFCIWFRYSYNHTSSGGYAQPGTSRRKYYDYHQDAILNAFNNYAVKMYGGMIVK